MSFVHLHVHSEYSMLDSTIRIDAMVAHAQQNGAEAIALTDHNNLFGAIDLLKAAKKKGIRPIYGAELNLAETDREDSEVMGTPTIVLLCKNLEGYRNLSFLLSRAHMDSPSKCPTPRIDRPLLAAHKNGLIALSSNLSGEIPQALLRGQIDKAKALALYYKELFGEDGFYLEVIRNGIEEQDEVNEKIVALSKDTGIPLVATSDAHYLKEEDAASHEILMCIQLGKMLPSLDAKARITDELYLADTATMVERFKDLPEAIENTVKIAEQCQVEIPLGDTFLPHYQVPEGEDAASYLRAISEDGLKKRLERIMVQYPGTEEQPYWDRLQVELDIINRMGFPGYFLIVWDFIHYAKTHGIPVGPGRGSGAGSLVAYSLGITDLDPLRYGLLFERFLNPERVSMPDFDIDFCQNKREQVIQYVTQKYGEDNVGQIITYGKMKAKAVIRDVARALGLSFAESDRAAKLIPDELGIDLKGAFEKEPRLSELRNEDERYEKLFETAFLLENLNRHAGMHAAGIVIGDKPLWEYVPLYAVRDNEGHVVRITQFAKSEVEEAGLVKFDFLGLTTLTIVDHALKLVNQSHEKKGLPPLDMSAIDLADPGVFKLISSGQTIGVFQLESSGFVELLMKLKPDCLEDIIAAVALYRPGPLQSGMVDSFILRKHGQEVVSYPHPSLETILKETYGVIVYQEQVMQSASALAGFSLGQADILRRAMGKKKPEEMAKQRVVFAKGCAERGVPEAQANEIFDLIEKFAGYGFNKSHSAAYGYITYQTAWLKVHYPVEFMAALLTAAKDSTDKVVRLIAECRNMGITVLPPSVNVSEHDFTTKDGAIRFGFGAIKGVGGSAIDSIIEAREEGDEGPFTDLFDFSERVNLKRVNKRVMEALVKSGAFDEFGDNRSTLWEALSSAIERGQNTQKDREAGQFSLFGALAESAGPEKKQDTKLQAMDEWPDRKRFSFEKECLGFYVSGHPLDRYKEDILRLGLQTIASLDHLPHESYHDEVRIAGVVSSIRERVTKSGTRIAFLQFEDLTGQIEVMVFSKPYPSFEPYLSGDDPLIITGKLRKEGDSAENSILKLRGESCELLSELRQRNTSKMRLILDASKANEGDLKKLEALFQENQDENITKVPIQIQVKVPEKGDVILALPESFRLPVSEEQISKCERLLGKNQVVLL